MACFMTGKRLQFQTINGVRSLNAYIGVHNTWRLSNRMHNACDTTYFAFSLQRRGPRNTYGEVTSEQTVVTLRSLCCGATLRTVWSSVVKIYRVIRKKVNPLVEDNVCIISILLRKWCRNNKHFTELAPRRRKLPELKELRHCHPMYAWLSAKSSFARNFAKFREIWRFLHLFVHFLNSWFAF